MNFALPFIGNEFHVSEATLGVALSAFFAGYSIVQIPGGWLSDKFGPRVVLVSSILFFTIFSIGTGLAWSIASLVVLRFLFGLFEGPFPTASFKGASEYFSKVEISKIQSILLASNPLSIAMAPLVAAPLVLSIGWRSTFIVMSSLGFIALLLNWLYFHPPVQRSSDKTYNKKIPIKTLFRYKSIWQFAIVNFGINILIWGFLTWLPSYMLKVRNLDVLNAGILSALPGFAGIVGMLLGGWMAC